MIGYNIIGYNPPYDRKTSIGSEDKHRQEILEDTR